MLCFEIFEHFISPEHLGVLVPFLEHPEPKVANKSLAMIARLKDPAAVPALTRLLVKQREEDYKNKGLTEAAILALGEIKIGATDAVPELIQALRIPSPNYGGCGTEPRQPDPSSAAMQTLVRMGPAIVGRLSAALNTESDESIRSAILGTLERIENPQGPLQRKLKTKSGSAYYSIKEERPRMKP